jgi:hypothetical protein
MNYSLHLKIDALLQAIIIIFYAMLIGKSEAPSEIAIILPIVLCSWQFINGLLSYKFFERDSKKIYVRVCGWSLIILSGFWGALWFISNIPGLRYFSLIFGEEITPVFWILLPIFATIMSVWYLYITVRDLYNMMFNTI